MQPQIHIKLIGAGGSTAYAQVYPFFLYQDELVSDLGLSFEYHQTRNLTEILPTLQPTPCDAFLVQTASFMGTNNDEMGRIISELRQKAPLVLLDSANVGNDGAWRFIDEIDALVVRAQYRDPEDYSRPYIDGRSFADYLVRQSHPRHWLSNGKFILRHLRDGEAFARYLARSTRKNLAGKPFTRSLAQDPAALEKMMLGWNVATTRPVFDAFRAQGFRPHHNTDRPIDVHCRVGTKAGFYCDWYYYHRQSALDSIRQLSPERNVVASNQRLSPADYRNEILSSKIAVSPFGWREVCIRDFEAVAAGCLLIKPDMSHLETQPDIYRPGETYVPVAWDLSDLREKCRYYLDHEKERQEIVEQAGKAYARYFTEQSFLQQIAELLAKLGLGGMA